MQMQCSRRVAAGLPNRDAGSGGAAEDVPCSFSVDGSDPVARVDDYRAASMDAHRQTRWPRRCVDSRKRADVMAKLRSSRALAPSLAASRKEDAG